MATGRTRPKESFNKRNRNNVTKKTLMTLALIKKARRRRCTTAYQKLLRFSAYGAPVQQIEQTNIEQPLFPDVKEDNGDKIKSLH